MSLKHQQLLDKLSLDDKVSLLSGANFWNTRPIDKYGIPSIMLTDGPHGLRKQAGKADHLGLNKSVPATCFPTAAALANTWNEPLIERVGQALGNEAAANQVSVVLGPGLNIVRDPLAGRAFEYFSEDPYVAGKAAAAMVRGIQSQGVAATPKHFAVNSQERLRMSINEVVDERTLREIYLDGFRRVVAESQPWALMTSYNRVNGTYANEHPHLLEGILRHEWGYKGMLVTDWGGNHDPVAAIKNGGALEMPASHGIASQKIATAVNAGDLDQSLVDARLDTILDLTYRTAEVSNKSVQADYDAHHKLATEAATESIVLLKNKDNILPLDASQKIAVIGDFAKIPRFQGAGSSLVNPIRLVSPCQALSRQDSLSVIGYAPGFKRTGKPSKALCKQAVSLANRSDVVLLFVGLDESQEAEGIDRSHMRLASNQLELIESVRAVAKKVVVVIAGGGAVELPFADDVDGIIYSSLGGQAIGQALVDIIEGRQTPSGKLALTWPLKYSDTPTANYFPGRQASAEHREGLYVGYRYYDTADVAVRYPFGYGLSYTTFEYSNLEVTNQQVTCSVTNSGKVAGSEVVQIYVRPTKSQVFRPVHELKGFSRVDLVPGETKQVTITLDDQAFAYFDTTANRWLTASGEYTIEVGSSSRDIRLTKQLTLDGDFPEVKDLPALEPYHRADVRAVDDAAFTALLGYTPPDQNWDRKAPASLDDTIIQLSYKRLSAKLFVLLLRSVQRILFAISKPYAANNVAFVLNLPAAKIAPLSGNKMSEKAVQLLFQIRK